MYWTNFIRLGYEVGLDEGVDRGEDEEEDDDDRNDGADDLEPLEPGLSAPADGLEHAPETVGDVQAHCNEPDDVEEDDPPFAEGDVQQEVGIVLIIAHAEHLGQLHLGPEMGQVEADETDDDDTEYEHVLGRPGIGRSLARHFIALPAAAGLEVLPGEPAAVDDVDQETEGEDGDHNGNESGAHEVAAELEQAVTRREKLLVSGTGAVFSGEGVDDREEVDGSVQEQEDEEEGAGDALDELLADGGGQEISHWGSGVSFVNRYAKIPSFLQVS